MKLQLDIDIIVIMAASVLGVSTFGADGVTDRDATENAARDRMVLSQRPERVGQLSRASDLIGMEVKNAEGQKLGKVENLLIDLQSGRILEIFVSSGGFLGLGNELSAVPPRAFRYDPEQKVLDLNMSKEVLAQAPHFKGKDWASAVGADARRAERYSDRSSVEPDNSGRNVRDRAGGPTASEQGRSQADREMTRKIRSEILQQRGLSSNARNAKVITANGHVTLRGPVNNDEEKRLLGEIAGRVAQADQVDNELEVKSQNNP